MSIYGEYKNTTISEILETSGGRGSRRTISVTTGLDGRRSLLLEISKDEPDILKGFIIGRRCPQNQEDDEENEVLGKEEFCEEGIRQEALRQEALREEGLGEEYFDEEDPGEEDPDEEDFSEEEFDEENFGEEDPDEEDFDEEDFLGEEIE